MKCFAVLACVLIFAVLGSAQPACRRAKSQIVEYGAGFTIQSVTLPSPSGPINARAVIPESLEAADPAVFSLSKLVGSESRRSVDMIPLAIELGKHGRPSILIERQLTWPEIAESVGTMQPAALCAEQWLSAHAHVRPGHWRFVGPESDAPTLDQVQAVGDTTSMTFLVVFPVAGQYEGQEENVNTPNLLRDTSAALDFLLRPFADGY